MRRRPAPVVSLNTAAEQQNWRGMVGDVLADKNVRGVVVSVFYRNRDYRIRHVGVRSSDLALLGAKLGRLATESE